MKRKRETWDFGESADLYSTKQEDLQTSLEQQNAKELRLESSSGQEMLKIPDLMQRRRHTYSLSRDKRVEGNEITRDIQLFVPDFLRESLWQRHQYSLDDVLHALRACPKEYIWQLALYYNVHILNSASRPSSCFIIRGGKKSAIDRMEKEFRREGSPFKAWRDRPSVLLKTRSCHKDPMYLPFHFVSRKTMDLLAELLPMEMQKGQTWLGQSVRHYARHLNWRTTTKDDDIALVPLGVYWRVLPQYDFALLNRILPYEAYCAQYGQNTSSTPLSEFTDLVYIGSQRFALLEEALYVVCTR